MWIGWGWAIFEVDYYSQSVGVFQVTHTTLDTESSFLGGIFQPVNATTVELGRAVLCINLSTSAAFYASTSIIMQVLVLSGRMPEYGGGTGSSLHDTSEVIIPQPISPTFGYTKEKPPHKLGSWLHDVRRGVSLWRPDSERPCRVSVYIALRRSLSLNWRHEDGNFDLQWRGGFVDVHTIRVVRLRGVVWMDVSWEGLGGHVPKREWGGVIALCGGVHVV